MNNDEVGPIGFIGFGAAGREFAIGLQKTGLRKLMAYDVVWSSEAKSCQANQAKNLASEIEVKVADRISNLVSEARTIISVVTPIAALSVAKEAARYMNKDKLYIDLNSKSPSMAREIGIIMAHSGAKFADVVAMGSVAKYGSSVPCLASGDGAEEAAKLNKYGMNIRVIGGKAGQASAVKMLRSVYTKGVAAVLFEVMLAAQKYDSIELVVESLEETENKMRFREMAKMRIEETNTHAKRRAFEMDEVCETLRAVKVDPIMSAATKQVLLRVATLSEGAGSPEERIGYPMILQVAKSL